MVNKVTYYIQFLWFSIKLNFIRKNVFFIDLDNTLADTWPDRRDMSTFKWSNVKLQPKVLEFVNNEIIMKNLYPIVLSARPINTYFVTMKWLSKNTSLPLQNLFLVKNADDKQRYFELALKKKKMGAIIDDCSHGHERGEVLYYETLIKYICRHEIPYYDFEFIKKIARN